jgi:hypothetical protein
MNMKFRKDLPYIPIEITNQGGEITEKISEKHDLQPGDVFYWKCVSFEGMAEVISREGETCVIKRINTVNDFKKMMLQKAGVKCIGESKLGILTTLWNHLSALGWSEKTKEPEETSNVDATALLIGEEWDDLEELLDKILAP